MLRPILLTAILLILTSASRTAHAQLYPVWDSVESRVSRADTVVLGRVVSIEAASKSQPLEDKHSTVVISVDEVLRGTAPARLTVDGYYAFWENTPARAAACGTCPEHGHRFLITLHTTSSNTVCVRAGAAPRRPAPGDSSTCLRPCSVAAHARR